MKTTLTYIVLLVLVSIPLFSQQRVQAANFNLRKLSRLYLSQMDSVYTQQQIQIQSMNGWYFTPSSIVIDSSKVRSYWGAGCQDYVTAGQTVNYGWGWITQTDWYKDCPEYPPLSDKFKVKAKLITGNNNLSGAWVGIAVQGSFGWYTSVGEYIDLDSTGWQDLEFDMSRVKKQTGAKNLGTIYLTFQIEAKDSCYVLADIAVESYTGTDSLGNNEVIYDDYKDTTSTGVFEQKQIPKGFTLEQNYPNPFNPSTTIKFSIPQREHVSLFVFNLLGQEVKNLINEEKQKGSYEVKFDASNLPSGIYFYKLQSGSFVETKKMLLMK